MLPILPTFVQVSFLSPILLLAFKIVTTVITVVMEMEMEMRMKCVGTMAY